MSSPRWKAYNELAWVDTILASPRGCEEEAELIVRLIRERSRRTPASLLHLGCGAGGHDYTFKRHFSVTGVDVSPGMLDIARRVNPEIAYILADMRALDLPRRFDAVAIPDSIDYMVTPADLRAAIETAAAHLEPGGVLLVVAHTREHFSNNNFVYSGCEGEVEVTVFENDRMREDGAGYEATLVYLLRRRGRLRIETEVHALGLFPQSTWLVLLGDAGLEVEQLSRSEGYEKYILEGGQYVRQVFIATKVR